MKASAIPAKWLAVWASAASGSYVRAVPQTTGDPTAASQTLGFPAETFLPVGAGGVAPDGRDFNGALNQATAWNQWQSAGGAVPWDSAFSTAIGGYPKGAYVAATTGIGNFWLCTVDDNTTNPDTGGSGWTKFTLPAPGQNVAVYTIVAGVQKVSINGTPYTTTGATTFPAPVSGFCSYEGRGAGGSGGVAASVSTIGGGGGAGGHVVGNFSGLTTATAVTLGAPGAAVSGSGVNGNAGASSSFGAVVFTGGASGGGSPFTVGGVSGVGSGASITNDGLGDGGNGAAVSASASGGSGGGAGGKGGLLGGNAAPGIGGGGGGSASGASSGAGGVPQLIVRY